jgi:hypothetical protein
MNKEETFTLLSVDHVSTRLGMQSTTTYCYAVPDKHLSETPKLEEIIRICARPYEHSQDKIMEGVKEMNQWVHSDDSRKFFVDYDKENDCHLVGEKLISKFRCISYMDYAIIGEMFKKK